MKKQKQARLILGISMMIFGTLGPFTRNIPVSSGELALYRAVLAIILIGGFLLISGRRSGKHEEENGGILRIQGWKTLENDLKKELSREVFLLFLSGAAMGINWILLFQAYRYTTVSAATLSYYFAPVLVTLVCPVLFRETMTKRQVLCFLMSTLGLIMITGIGDLQQGSTHLTGIAFGLGAAVFYASVILLNKWIRHISGIHRTFFQFLAAILTLIPYVAATGGIRLKEMDSKGWICLLIVGLVHTGMSYCLYFSALKDLKGQETAILSYIDPLVAVLVSVTILGESLSWIQAAGGALILGFTLWNELDHRP